MWSAWFRAHYKFAKLERADFDLGRWQIDHTAIVRRAAAEFEGQGYTVTVEKQNQLSLVGKLGTLAGRPDVVAIKGDEGWVIDAKTGQPRPSDRVQVLLYMWALPRANPAAFGGVKFKGRVEYAGQYHVIEAEEVDAVFTARVSEVMRMVCGQTEPSKAPSFAECRCCPLMPEDCSDRVDKEEAFAGTTDEF